MESFSEDLNLRSLNSTELHNIDGGKSILYYLGYVYGMIEGKPIELDIMFI